MLLPLIIIFTITLLYLSVTERFRHYATLVGLQGWLLMAIAMIQLWETPIFERLFITVETIAVKGILIPYLLFRIIRQTNIDKVSRRSLPPFVLFFFSLVALVVSIWIVSYITDSTFLNRLFFGVSLFGLLNGMILITTHRRIFSHLIGFLIIENSVFLFSLAAGVEMPMIISVGILLDILLGILMLGLFVNKIGHRIQGLDNEELTKLKD